MSEKEPPPLGDAAAGEFTGCMCSAKALLNFTPIS